MRSRWRARLVAVLAVLVTSVGAGLVVPAPASAETIRDQQWWLRTLKVDEAHKITRGAGVVVAVVDSGVGSHPDLDGQVLDGVSFEPGIPARRDTGGHGTAMACLIACKGSGPQSLQGIAPEAKISPVQVMPSDLLGGSDSLIAEGITWAVDNGAKVINLSLSRTDEATTPDMMAAVQHAIDHDVVVVASVGNLEKPGDGKVVHTPARIPGVVAVSATEPDGQMWSGSVTGPEVVLAAPGGADMILAMPGDHLGLGRKGGTGKGPGATSSATAIVSGAAALIRAKYPDLTAGDVIKRLIDTADDAGAPGRDPQYGFGRLNLVKALTADVPKVGKNPLIESGKSSEATAAGSSTRASTGYLWVGLGVLGGILVVVLVAVALAIVLVRRRRRT